MNRTRGLTKLISALCVAGFSAVAYALPAAQGTLTSTDLGGGQFRYDITLTNTSAAETVGTFWYAWIPGQNYLATSPLTVTSPINWASTITHSTDMPDGFGIRWIANDAGSRMSAGASLDFSFTSTDTPSSVTGNSAFFANPPVGTSFVYGAGPFSDDGAKFTVVPEPGVYGLLGAGSLAMVAAVRRKVRKSKAEAK